MEPLAGCIVNRTMERGVKILQWVPESHLEVEVRHPGRTACGIGEVNLKEAAGTIVQLERYGFVMIESISDSKVLGYFSHR